jgi:NAD(P)-dependent dehydrogenase (short-subunit alcohol dehydrogenase family)
MKLKNHTALVTGGSSGIGAEVCLQLAAEGANVGVVASADAGKAEIIVDRIKKDGGKANAFVGNVAKPASVAKLVKDAKSALGPIDILINAAGVYGNTPIGNTDEFLINHLIDINLKGTFRMINAIAPGMKDRRNGKIVNFSSVNAYIGVESQSLYCACKAGIDLMTRAMARELAPYDVNINSIAPGATRTPMNEALRTLPKHKGNLDAFVSNTPSNTTFSDPAEIARMVVFLASDDARPMHGSNVLMDEGLAAGI